MSRYATATPAPPSPTREGDSHLVGLNLKLHPSMLPEGILSRAENNRCTDGTAAPRAGTRTPLFANAWKSTSAALLGSGVYSNPNGEELGLLCTGGGVVAVRSGNDGAIIYYGSGSVIELTDQVEFSQQFDKMLLHRTDPTKPTLSWDGNLATRWLPVNPLKALGNGIDIIPNPPWSINFLGRAWFPVPGEPDALAASDINDYTVYDSDLHVFRVNAGTSDEIVAAYPFAQSAIIVGKRRSIDLLANIPGDLGDSFINAITLGLSPSSAPPPSMTVVSTTVGIKARKSGKMVGEAFFFLSDAGEGGVYRMTQVTTDRLAVDPVPVSDAIAPLIKRINWQYADKAVAEVDGIYYCLAVPLDGATFNNAVLVYNRTTEQWMGVDLWFGRDIAGRAGRTLPPLPNPLRLDNVLALDFYGTRRLFAINHTTGWTHLLYEGLDDQLQPVTTQTEDGADEQATYPIVHLIESRAYNTLDLQLRSSPGTLGGGANSRQAFDRLEVNLATFDALLTLDLIVDAGDVRPLTGAPLEPSRTNYRNFGRAPFQLDNARGDFSAAQRDDYSAQVGDNLLAPAPLEILFPQERTERFSALPRGRHVRLRVTNTGGHCSTLGILLESTGKGRNTARRTL